MKTSLLFLVSTLILAVAGWNVTDRPSASAAPDHALIEVETGAELSGEWYSFSTGSLIRLNAEGTADFSQDTNSSTGVIQAQTWFADDQWHITFINYDGAEKACLSAVGTYEMQTFEDGYLKFSTIQDDCQLRADLLGGNEALGHASLFHPLDQ